MKPDIITKIILTFCITLLIHHHSEAQSREELWKLKPVNEFGLQYSIGGLSNYKYQDTLGKSFFVPYHNRNFSISFLYSRLLKDNFKFSIGFGINGMETTQLIKFDTAQVPGTGKYINTEKYNTGLFAIGSVPYDYFYADIPLSFEYRLMNIRNRHQLWFGGGINITTFSHIDWGLGYQIGYNDSLNFTLYQIDWVIGLKKYVFMPSVKVYYSYNITPLHQLNIGFTARFNNIDILKGTYDFVPELPQSHAAGKISNTFSYVGMTVGYSFNNRRHSYLKNSRLLESEKINPDRDESLPDKFEIIPWLGLYGLPFYPRNDQPGIATFQPNAKTTFNFLTGLSFKKYINGNYSWEASMRFSATTFQLFPTYLSETTTMLDFPAGLNRKFKLSNTCDIDVGLNAYPFVNIYNPVGYKWSQKMDSLGNMILKDSFAVTSYNIIGFGLNPNIKFSYSFKNRNKIYIMLQYNIDLIKSYDINYTLLQDNGSYYSGIYPYRRNFLKLTVGYGFTGKRYRWRKDI